MKRLIIFLLLFAAIKVAGQTTGYLRFDTVKIMKQSGTCELYLINKTKDSLGLLTNVGGGLTQFRKSRMLNDSTLVVGLDTLIIRGGTSAAGGLDQLTGDGTAGPGTGSQVLTISANAITNPKLAQMAALTAKVNATNSTANAQDLAFSTDGNVLVRDGTTLIAGPLDLAKSGARTGLLPEDNLQTFKPWPAEYVWNTIYEKSSWPDLSDFSTLGTAVISLSSGYVNMTATTQDYTPRIVFKPEWATGLNYWKVTSRFKIIGFGSPSNWLGPFIKSLVNHDGANFGYQFFTSVLSSGGGNSFFTTENGSIILNPGAGSGVTKSVNDVLEFVMERTDTALTFTLTNLTTTTTATPITYTFPAANTPNVLPNVGQWGVLLNAAGGTFQLQYLKIESAEKVAPNVLIVGNSKTANGATSFNRRYPTQLNATYPTVTWSAGSAERMDPDMFYKRPELTFRNPEYVILGSVYDNDIRASFAIQDVIDDMIKLENYWKGGGATVLWMAFPEDSTAGGASGLTAVRNWLVANRPDHYINTWDALRTGVSDNRLSDTYDAGDGVHINAAAHDLIVSTIIASGKVATISANRRTTVRTKDLNVRPLGDSVGLAFDWRRVAGNIPKVNSTYDVTGSRIWENSVGNVIISSSIQPTAILSNGMLDVQGVVTLSSNLAGLRFYNRDNSANFFDMYANSSTLYLGYNGTDGAAIGTKANLRIGRMTGISNTVMFPYFQIQGTNTFSSSAQGHNGLIARLDSNVIHYTGAGTGLGDVTGTSVGHDAIMATNTTNADTVSSFTFRGPPRDSTNFTSTIKLSGYVREGAFVFGSTLSILKRGLDLYATNETRQMLVVDTVTGKVDRMDIPTGGGLSGLTAGRVPYTTGATSIADDANLLYATSNAGTLSLGTSATVGHFNLGGNRNFDGTGTSTGYGVGFNSAATTYTDNVTSASGSTTFTQHLLAGPTLAASNATITATAPATLRVEAPTAGSNVTITIPYAVAAFGGAVWFNGAVKERTSVGVHNAMVSYSENIITCDASGGNFNQNLPDAGVYAGFSFTFKRLDNSGNTCTITRAGSDTIDGATTYSLTAQYKYVKLVSNGTAWMVIANN